MMRMMPIMYEASKGVNSYGEGALIAEKALSAIVVSSKDFS
jgi:hypothetical protein